MRWLVSLLAAATGMLPIAAHAQGFGPAYPFAIPANTLLGNPSAGSTVPQNVAVNGCSAAGNGLTYTSGTGFGCATNLITTGGALGTPSSGDLSNTTSSTLNLSAGGALKINGTTIITGNATYLTIQSLGGAADGSILIGYSGDISNYYRTTTHQFQSADGVTSFLTLASAGATFGGQMTNTHLSTGTNADFLCLSAGGQFLIQTSACTISSLRFKHVVGEYREALDTIKRLDPIVFSMKAGPRPNPDKNYGRVQIGLSAENVAKNEPRCAIYEDDGKTPKSYRQECLIAVLIAGMKEQQAQIARLEARLR